ncbi:MAG: nucleotide exchange factor GrpE [Acidimicrobiia bacterium]|nr:nucleotide exchange factor GrpE [Acidimicrobiia bacterium]
METDTEKGPAPEQAAAEEKDQAVLSDPAQRLEELCAERDRLSAQNAELEDLVKRRQADHENFRRRVEKERAEIFEMATIETIRALLPILDDFERAQKNTSDEGGAAREYVKGMQLIYQRLQETLGKLGLEPQSAAGESFDPNRHHAVQKEKREDCEDQTILEEYQRGYQFKGKLLRAAMVKVSTRD